MIATILSCSCVCGLCSNSVFNLLKALQKAGLNEGAIVAITARSLDLRTNYIYIYKYREISNIPEDPEEIAFDQR